MGCSKIRRGKLWVAVKKTKRVTAEFAKDAKKRIAFHVGAFDYGHCARIMRNSIFKHNNRQRFVWLVYKTLPRFHNPAGVGRQNKYAPHRAQRIAPCFLRLSTIRQFVCAYLCLQLLDIHIYLQWVAAVKRIKIRGVNKSPYDVHGKQQLRNWVFFNEFVYATLQPAVQIRNCSRKAERAKMAAVTGP